MEILPGKKEEGKHSARIHREDGVWDGLGDRRRGADRGGGRGEGIKGLGPGGCGAECGTGLIHLVSFFVKNNTITRTMPCNLSDTCTPPFPRPAAGGGGRAVRLAWCACWPGRCAAPP